MLRAKETIDTHDTNVAAVYLSQTCRIPAITRDHGKPLATYGLIADDATLAILAAYAAGELLVNAKQFAQCREYLYRKLREVRV